MQPKDEFEEAIAGELLPDAPLPIVNPEDLSAELAKKHWSATLSEKELREEQRRQLALPRHLRSTSASKNSSIANVLFVAAAITFVLMCASPLFLAVALVFLVAGICFKVAERK